MVLTEEVRAWWMLVAGKAEDRGLLTSGKGDKLRGKLNPFPVFSRKHRATYREWKEWPGLSLAKVAQGDASGSWHMVGLHLRTQSTPYFGWKCETLTCNTCRQKALCGQPYPLFPSVEGGGYTSPGPEGPHEQSPLDMRSEQNINLCSDKYLWLGVPSVE